MAVLKPGDRLGVYTSNMGGKEQWQTIVKKIRAEVNKLRVVRVVNRKPAADKASRVDSRVDSKVASRVAKVDNRAVRKVISKATANLFEEEGEFIRAHLHPY